MKKFSVTTIGGDVRVWHVERLWKLARELPVQTVALKKITCFDDTLWFDPVRGLEPTCRRVAAHARRIYEADFDKPVILSATGHVMDGMHRVARAWILGLKTIRAVKFPRDPEPDERHPLPPGLRQPGKATKAATGPGSAIGAAAIPQSAKRRRKELAIPDFDYAKRLLDYYNHPANPVHLTRIADKASEVDAQVAEPGHWRREVTLAMRRALHGRRVLEIACGTGIWTRLIVDVAEFVLATDASPRILARAKKLVRYGKKIPAGRLGFLQLDAYDLGSAPGEFDGALAMDWFQHVPCARHAEFLDALHRKLCRGATVFIGTSHYSEKWRADLFQRPGELDSYSHRRRPDGSQYQVIDNLFGEEELNRIFVPVARRLRFRSGQAYSWVTYQTAKRKGGERCE